MAAVTGGWLAAGGAAVARGCAGAGLAGCVEAAAVGIAWVVLGAVATLGAPEAATACLPRLSVAANTPAVAMAARTSTAIIAAVTPARKLISSSRALTAARRRD